MDQRQEMMDDAIDDVTGLEDEEEGEEVVKEVLDEIGVDLGQSVCAPYFLVEFERTELGLLGDGGWWLTICVYSWERHLWVYKRLLLRTDESRKLLGEGEEHLVEVVVLMTIYRRG